MSMSWVLASWCSVLRPVHRLTLDDASSLGRVMSRVVPWARLGRSAMWWTYLWRPFHQTATGTGGSHCETWRMGGSRTAWLVGGVERRFGWDGKRWDPIPWVASDHHVWAWRVHGGSWICVRSRSWGLAIWAEEDCRIIHRHHQDVLVASLRLLTSMSSGWLFASALRHRLSWKLVVGSVVSTSVLQWDAPRWWRWGRPLRPRHREVDHTIRGWPHLSCWLKLLVRPLS